MGLFSSTPTRNRTYVKGTPLEPQDANDLQDVAVAVRSERWMHFPFSKSALETNITFLIGGNYTGGIAASAGSAFYKGGLVPGVLQGSTIKGLRAVIKGTGSVQNVNVRIMLNDFSGSTFSSKGQLQAVDPSSTPTVYTLTPFTAFTLDNGDFLTVEADLPLNTTVINGFQLLIKPPW